VFFLYLALGIAGVLTAWLVNRLTHHSWFTVPRTIALIAASLIIAAFIQSRIGSTTDPRNNPAASSASSMTNREQSPGDVPPSTGSAAPPAMVTRTLASQSTTNGADDPSTIGYFSGYVESESPQEINGTPFARNLNFPLVCSDTSDKFADYNLGRHFETFTATIGPSDISKSKRYQFEIWTDDQRVWSKVLGHGQAEKVNIPVRNVLKLRLAACSLDETVIMEREGGGIFGDPQVHGTSDKVPPAK